MHSWSIRERYARIAGLGLALGVILAAASPVFAADPLDYISCRSATVTMLVASPDVTIYSLDLKGIDRSNHPNKLFDNFTHRCMGVFAIIGGKRSGNGHCRYQDPQGDSTFIEWTAAEKAGAGTWKFINGTGPWKGVTGGGDYETVAGGKPIEDGTNQFCIRVTGTMERN